jgi:hypothetical protein
MSSNSATNTFANELLSSLANTTPSFQNKLLPINRVTLLDSNGNQIVTIADLQVSYSSGVLTIMGEFEATSNATIASELVGSYYNGVLKYYFQVTQGYSITQGNLYTFTITIQLNNINISVSPFSTASVNASKLIDYIGNALAGNPVYAGKSGFTLGKIYLINTTSNVNQSYGIPISIINISNGLLTIGGTLSNDFVANKLVLRTVNGLDILSITGVSPITFKKARQVLIEISV